MVKLFPLLEALRLVVAVALFFPMHMSSDAMVLFILAHMLLVNIVDTKEFYSGTNWFSAFLQHSHHSYMITSMASAEP